MSDQFPADKQEHYRGGRPCFICGSPYRCMHREPLVDRAEMWQGPVDFAALKAVIMELWKEQA